MIAIRRTSRLGASSRHRSLGGLAAHEPFSRGFLSFEHRSVDQNRRFMERRFARQLRHDAAVAITQLRRRPGFAVVATLTLALGVAVTTAVFAVVDTVILRTLPFMESERLMLVRRAQPGGKTPVETSYPRSEEHTSELQSQFHLVCRLLLE